MLKKLTKINPNILKKCVKSSMHHNVQLCYTRLLPESTFVHHTNLTKNTKSHNLSP